MEQGAPAGGRVIFKLLRGAGCSSAAQTTSEGVRCLRELCRRKSKLRSESDGWGNAATDHPSAFQEHQ